MEVDERATRLLGMSIYNTEMDKYGFISGIEISKGFGLYWIFRGYYDSVNDNDMVTLEDIEKGKIKIVHVMSNKEELNNSMREVIYENVKFSLGDKFSPDMIITVNEDEYDNYNAEKKKNGTEYILGVPIKIDAIAAELIYEDFRLQELYKKFQSGVFTKEQMYCGMINYMAQLYREEKERNFQLFMKYEYKKLLEEIISGGKDNGVLPGQSDNQEL